MAKQQEDARTIGEKLQSAVDIINMNMDDAIVGLQDAVTKFNRAVEVYGLPYAIESRSSYVASAQVVSDAIACLKKEWWEADHGDAMASETSMQWLQDRIIERRRELVEGEIVRWYPLNSTNPFSNALDLAKVEGRKELVRLYDLLAQYSRSGIRIARGE